ncbi:hypothetical protein BUQ74_07720 [Leptospira weilii serovar Heyan]|uniref:Uncharacterized protein n=1 Tax=Leptospira weilii str. UI 13098 TaxID=1088542 RepID=M6Q5D0_9LEPT|nr:hypothetical protein LEP1GSC108_2357 [Leptospira weilii str. UI 13098]OMI17825.1 hypothetical protein BUQ74_07720 [Leptospira weilii serovar Heyan]
MPVHFLRKCTGDFRIKNASEFHNFSIFNKYYLFFLRNRSVASVVPLSMILLKNCRFTMDRPASRFQFSTREVGYGPLCFKDENLQKNRDLRIKILLFRKNHKFKT